MTEAATGPKPLVLDVDLQSGGPAGLGTNGLGALLVVALGRQRFALLAQPTPAR